MTGRSYPTSKVRDGREETPRIRGQERRLREVSCVRGQGRRPGEATSCPRPGVVTLRSLPEPEAEARGGSWEQPPTPEARAGGWEEQHEERWLRRHRRA